jgi:hypothetical protein
MGGTVPSFRIVLEEEKQEWKPFRNALDKSERKEFDDMLFDIPRLCISQLALLRSSAYNALSNTNVNPAILL